MTKTQKIFMAVFTALVFGGLCLACIATQVVTATWVWVIALVVAILHTLVWLVTLRFRVTNKSTKTIWQCILAIVLVITFIILFMGMGGKNHVVETDPKPGEETTTEAIGEEETLAPELPIDEEVDGGHVHSYKVVAKATTTYTIDNSKWYKVTVSERKQCSCGSVVGGQETKELHKHSYTNGKCICGYEKPTEPPVTEHTHNYKVVAKATTTYTNVNDTWYKITVSEKKQCSCGSVVGGQENKEVHNHSYTNGKCICGYEKPTEPPVTEHTHNYKVVAKATTTYTNVDGTWYKVTIAEKKQCSCGSTIGGQQSKELHNHSYTGGKCACGEVKKSGSFVIKARLTSSETGYLCVTPEDSLTITFTGMDLADLRYAYDACDGSGRLVENEGITFTYKYTDPDTGAKVYSMRLSEELRNSSLDIKFYVKGSNAAPTFLTVEPQYED